jgi:IS5 family transposase
MKQTTFASLTYSDKKRLFGYTKVRYKGLEKNAAQVFALIGLTNLYLARRKLMA